MSNNCVRRVPNGASTRLSAIVDAARPALAAGVAGRPVDARPVGWRWAGDADGRVTGFPAPDEGGGEACDGTALPEPPDAGELTTAALRAGATGELGTDGAGEVGTDAAGEIGTDGAGALGAGAAGALGTGAAGELGADGGESGFTAGEMEGAAGDASGPGDGAA